MKSQKINEVRQRIESACARSGRNPSEIVLIAVTKTVSPETIQEAIRCGLNTFGENKVQEAGKKINELGLEAGISWHMIGHLQTNKVKDAIELFSLIHAVDSLRLCEKINERADKIGKVVDILLEINLSGEKTKYGFSEKGLFDIIKSMEKYPNIRIRGLMTMTPFSEEPEDSRKYFRRLFKLSRNIREMPLPRNVEMKYISMGMTQDFEVAIEEGANMVRVGRAIFGERG
ncbi:MAG: YggS family pyridoxal phosphate-dependent enzyme [Candidatus Omnitrophica bacterium]|nr:YggS family pyridoxal phosphate-dependent enzyme [Candidatus Omnitrophota bacterium]